MTDTALAAAAAQITASHMPRPAVQSFFDEATFTATHVVYDATTRHAAVIDSVLDFDPASGRTATHSADAVIAFLRKAGLKLDWLLETHAHADHLSAAAYIQEQCGGHLGIGEHITTVQQVFGRIFNLGGEFARDGSQFDHLFKDGEAFNLGGIPAMVLHVPGHTPADIAYVIGDAVFAGDTLFMPDYGTARTDFPGGSAGRLYHSIHRLLSLPEAARLFLCHDYKAPGREEYAWETSIGAERQGNIHVSEGVSEAEFTAMRQARDATLAMPRLLLPSVQVNIRAGHLPPPEENGVSYLKLPLDML